MSRETGWPKGQHRAPGRPHRDAEGTDLLELLEASGEDDHGTQNPFR